MSVTHAGFEITILGYEGPKDLARFTDPALMYSTLALTHSNQTVRTKNISFLEITLFHELGVTFLWTA
jgi:hypothetical protein